MIDVEHVEIGGDRGGQVSLIEEHARGREPEVGARVADIELHAALHRVAQLGRRLPVGVEHARRAAERVGDDVARSERAQQVDGGDRRREREPAEVHHDRPVARDLLGGVEERRDVRVVDGAARTFMPTITSAFASMIEAVRSTSRLRRSFAISSLWQMKSLVAK